MDAVISFDRLCGSYAKGFDEGNTRATLSCLSQIKHHHLSYDRPLFSSCCILLI